MPKKSFIYEEDDPAASFISTDTQEAPKRGKGRARNNDLIRIIDGGSSSQNGLTAEWTRASFIMRLENKHDLEDIAYTNRETITKTLDDALTAYFSEYKKSHKLVHKKR